MVPILGGTSERSLNGLFRQAFARQKAGHWGGGKGSFAGSGHTIAYVFR